MQASWHVTNDPPDDALLGPTDVAAWLQVDATWLVRAIAQDALPVMGYTTAGDPVVCSRRGSQVAAPPRPAGGRDVGGRDALRARR
jgi:hypothetical protein